MHCERGMIGDWRHIRCDLAWIEKRWAITKGESTATSYSCMACNPQMVNFKMDFSNCTSINQWCGRTQRGLNTGKVVASQWPRNASKFVRHRQHCWPFAIALLVCQPIWLICKTTWLVHCSAIGCGRADDFRGVAESTLICRWWLFYWCELTYKKGKGHSIKSYVIKLFNSLLIITTPTTLVMNVVDVIWQRFDELSTPFFGLLLSLMDKHLICIRFFWRR